MAGQAAGCVTIQLDSSMANKITGEHYIRTLETPVQIPYMARVRCQLESLCFSNTFTNVDSTRLDNNVIRFAWKVHQPTDKNKSYDDLDWHYMEIKIPTGFISLSTLEQAVAKAIYAQTPANPQFGTDLLPTLQRMVQNKAVYNRHPEPIAISPDGTRPVNEWNLSSRLWYWGPHAKHYYPQASGATNTIVIVMDEPVDYEEHYKSANDKTGAAYGISFDEKYTNQEKRGKNHWYTNIPTFLIGSALVAVQDEYKYTPTDELVDVTTKLGLEQGLRVLNVFNVNGTAETYKSSHWLPPAVYQAKDGDSSTPAFFLDDRGYANANGTYALELEVPSGFQSVHPGAVASSPYMPSDGYVSDTSNKLDLWRYSGNFWPRDSTYNFSTKEWKNDHSILTWNDYTFKVQEEAKADRTAMRFAFAPPGDAQTVDFNHKVLHGTKSEKDTARDLVATGQGGTAYAYRGYGAHTLASTDVSVGNWVQAMSGNELAMIAQEPQDKGHEPNSLIVGVGASIGLEQWQRSIKPLNFVTDPTQGSKGISFLTGWPGLYVCKGSTVMTELVGFNDDDLCDWSDNGGPKLAQMAKQNPFLAEDGMVRAVADRKDSNGRPVGMLSVDTESNIVNVRSLCFHCPTLAPPSYLPDGTLGGSQLASVPVLVGEDEMQNWQAQYDTSVPSDIHGAEINQIEFYLTNQDQNVQDMQGSNFTATLRILWDDPIPMRPGEAGAVYDQNVDLKAVQFRRR